ncbi:hypothetical protein [uncultured Mailhella sp.]|uniref:hypothetical protein n=1 Tax=uncultured Mailhella sp. TaxID=1981031 RepID=UPI00261CF255|nr:hypothetical protein [uncultured Mailhella sp.]
MEIDRIEQNLKNLLEAGRLDGKQIYILGANEEAVSFINFLGASRISAILDSNEKTNGLTMCGRPIRYLQDELVPYSPKKVILLTNGFSGQDIDKLNMMGYIHDVQRFWICEPVAYMETKKEKILKKIKSLGIFRLIENYLRLRKAVKYLSTIYSQGYQHIMFSPYPSIGDIYIYGQYLSDGVISTNQSTVFLVCGNACKTMAKECGFNNVIALNSEMITQVSKLKCILGDQQLSLESLHYDYFPPVSIMLASVYRNGITFDELLEKKKFHSKYNLSKKIISPEEDQVESYCRKCGIEKGKSVLLAPYAKSVPAISSVFWENLTVSLKRAGYKVFMNKGGPSEMIIPGTIAITPPFSLLAEVIEYAGAIISLRSGICDICSYTTAKKIILYPKKQWKYGEEYITHVGFSNFPNIKRLAEFECEQIPEQRFTDEILQTFLKI